MTRRNRDGHTGYVSPTVKPGDSIPWSSVHDDPDIVRYDWIERDGRRDLVRVHEVGIPFTWIDLATFGDYDNSSEIERSNHRVMREQFPWLVHVHGSHGSEGLGYLGKRENQNPTLLEALDALADYPILDESDCSELEMDMESEAWSDYGRADFLDELAKHLDAMHPEREHDRDAIDLYFGDDVYTLWHDGCDAYNVNGGNGYVIETGGGVHFYTRHWFDAAARGAEDARSTWSREARASLAERMATISHITGTIVPEQDPELDLAVRRALLAIHLGWSGTAAPRELVKQCTDRESCSVLADWLDERTPLAAPDRQMDLDLPFVLATGTEVHASA